MGNIIGIDLGTSTTEVAVLQEGKPVLLLNFDGNMVTPSVVGIDESGNYMVGEKAKAQLILRPERTIAEVKRKIGTEELIHLGQEKLTPVEVSAQILSYVKRYASAALEEEITEAVISVPAYFNEIQRRATVEAGKLAGLTVKRITNEPTAAALSYGLNRLEEESIVLIYDLGGGTFDVTLLEMFNGVLEVKASSGDNQLGGKDFDACLIQWFLDCFEKKNHINLKNDAIAMAKLKDEAEKCKIALSSNSSYQVNLPMLKVVKGQPYSLEETITVEQFEAMIAPYMERTHQPIRRVLADSNISPEEIDYILLVGGSTRISLVKRDILEFLGQEPVSAVHPDYAVAEGAAIQAGIISGTLNQEESIIMTDVNPFSLGISALIGPMELGMSVIIPRNTTIPVTKEELYSTSYDGQTEADILVYQGESNRVEENQFLGKFRMSGIPKNQGGKETLKVLFSYNMNGMLHVEATVLSTGEKASIQLDLTGVKGALDYHETVDVSDWDKKNGARKYRSTIRQSEKLAKQLEKKEKEEVENLIYMLKKAILNEDDLEAEDLETELLVILGDKSEN